MIACWTAHTGRGSRFNLATNAEKELKGIVTDENTIHFCLQEAITGYVKIGITDNYKVYGTIKRNRMVKR